MAHTLHIWGHRGRETAPVVPGIGVDPYATTPNTAPRRGRVLKYSAYGGATLLLASGATWLAFFRGGDNEGAEKPGAAGPVPAFSPTSREPSPVEGATSKPVSGGDGGGDVVGNIVVPDIDCTPKVTRVDKTHVRVEPQLGSTRGYSSGKFVTTVALTNTVGGAGQVEQMTIAQGLGTPVTVEVPADISIENHLAPVTMYYVPNADLPADQESLVGLVRTQQAAPVACGDAVIQLMLANGGVGKITG